MIDQSSDPRCGGLISRLACARARQAGIPVRTRIRRAGLTVEEIEDKRARLPVQNQIKFVELIAQALGDRDLGFHLALDCDLRDSGAGLLYYVPASAGTLGEALQRLERYSVIVNEGVSLKVRKGKSLHINFQYTGVNRHSDRHQMEFWMTWFIRMCRHLTNQNIKPVAVRIAHHRPEKTFGLQTFARARVVCGSGVDQIDLPQAYWKLRIEMSDPHLHHLLLQHCEEALSRRLNTSLLKSRVESVVAELLPHGQVQVKAVAVRLGISPRTLARKLASESLSFSELLRELRSALAERYLADQNLQISQVAWLLGYSEIATFTHAFRRWTGKTPSAFRRHKIIFSGSLSVS